MKKLLLLSLIIINALACSSDDENSISTKQEILVEKSPWLRQDFKVIEIIENGSQMTNEEIENALIMNPDKINFSFNLNGSGSWLNGHYTSEGEWISFNYEYDEKNNSIDFTQDYPSLNSVIISEKQFTYTFDYTIVDDEESEDDVMIKVEWIYIPGNKGPELTE